MDVTFLDFSDSVSDEMSGVSSFGEPPAEQLEPPSLFELLMSE